MHIKYVNEPRMLAYDDNDILDRVCKNYGRHTSGVRYPKSGNILVSFKEK